LLMALVSFTLSEEGLALAEEEFGFVKVPAVLVAINEQSLDLMKKPLDFDEHRFIFESAATTLLYEGAGHHVISAKRRTWAEFERALIEDEVFSLQDTVENFHAQMEGLKAQMEALEATQTDKIRQLQAEVMTLTAVKTELQAQIQTLKESQVVVNIDNQEYSDVTIAAIVIACAACVVSCFCVFKVMSLANGKEGGYRRGREDSSGSQTSGTNLVEIELNTGSSTRASAKV